MKLKNIKEVEEFRKVIHACAGDVYLKSQDGDVFNLKSALSEYIALGQLLSEQGDNLELFADRREDEARLINFLAELDKENENCSQWSSGGSFYEEKRRSTTPQSSEAVTGLNEERPLLSRWTRLRGMRTS